MTQRPDNPPRIGVGVIVRRDDEVLLIHRHNAHGTGTWSTPGGHLDYGETPEQCAERETLEETGVRVGGLRFRGITNDVFVEDGLHYVTIWMEGRYAGGDAIVHAPGELTEVKWAPMKALPSPLFLCLENFLNGGLYETG